MSLLDRIAGRKIVVVGDVMLDRYWWGSVERISPEAPVPIVKLQRSSLVPGGAANVAANLAGLGALPYLFGAKGDDPDGLLLDDVLTKAGIGHFSVFSEPGRITTLKGRVVAHSQHVVRIDQESTHPISDELAASITARLTEDLRDADAVIVSDYAKGFLSMWLLQELFLAAKERRIPVMVDPKGKDFSKYAGASVITPNKREAAEACGVEVDEFCIDDSRRLMEDLDLRALLITEGEHGMTLYERDGISHHFEALAHDVFDVTGAGDTVISAFTAAVAAGAEYVEAASFANSAAGLVVEQVGTTSIDREMLELAGSKARPAVS